MTYRPSITKFNVGCIAGLLFFAGPALAQGGCGSSCLPLESLNAISSQISDQKIRMAVTWQYGEFDNFLVGDTAVTNPGGNSAVIQDVTVFLDYGLTDRFTLSTLLPYIKKKQQTNRFGQRTASELPAAWATKLISRCPWTSCTVIMTTIPTTSCRDDCETVIWY